MREWQITQSSNDFPLSPIHLGMLYPFAYSQDLLSGIPSLMGARAGEIGMKECNEWLVDIEGLFDQFECHRRCTFQLGHDYYLVALHYRSMCMCMSTVCSQQPSASCTLPSQNGMRDREGATSEQASNGIIMREQRRRHRKI